MSKDPTIVQRKVAVIGARAVGKTALVQSVVTGSFVETYDPTIETTHTKTIRFRKVHFATDIVDTAGIDDEYSRLSRHASLGVHGYALVFSTCSRHSFDQIPSLNRLLLSTLGDAPDVPRIMVGTMADMATEQRQVGAEEAQTFADSLRIPYVECSSKTGENVSDVFTSLLKEIEKGDGLLAEVGEGGCIVS